MSSIKDAVLRFQDFLERHQLRWLFPALLIPLLLVYLLLSRAREMLPFIYAQF